MGTNENGVNKLQQQQMLKIVTHSFYRELIKYGVDRSDVVSVSMNLLDHATENGHETNSENYIAYKISQIEDNWKIAQTLSMDNISIKPLQEKHIPEICEWLQGEDVKRTFISFFPRNKEKLQRYLLQTESRNYFAISLEGNGFVGIIGADNIHAEFKRLEMKKFIGSALYQNKGIGKHATFLFLYYSFQILHANKVYIHSLDTNIKNINLNARFGFEAEGIFYKDVIMDGAYQDVLRMGLLKERWQQIFI